MNLPRYQMSRRHILAAAAGVVGASAMEAGARNAGVPTLKVGPRALYRNFQGWGTSLAWWAHIVGGFQPHVREHYLKRIFHTDDGLGLTVARYNIGGGENPKYHFLTRRAVIPGYAPHPPRFNWAADKNQRLILHECMAMGVNQVQAFSNSPPWYMTISGSVTGGKNGVNNLRPKYFRSFAEYLAIVVAHFRHVWHINFQTLDPFNEPVSNWWRFGGAQEGCRIGNREQNIIIPMLYRALRDRDLATQIAAPDDNGVNQTIQSFQSYSPLVRREVAQIDTHSYHGHGRIQLREMARAAGKRLWMSEYGDGDPSGLTMAMRIIKDIKELQPETWVYWQVVDGPGWGMMVNDENGRDTGFRTTNKYFVMAQFSRFIRPGDWIMPTNDNCIASYRREAGVLNVVAVNPTHSARRILIDISGFDVRPSPVRTHVTDDRHRLRAGVEQEWQHRYLHSALPPRSVKTWVFSDCRLSEV